MDVLGAQITLKLYQTFNLGKNVEGDAKEVLYNIGSSHAHIHIYHCMRTFPDSGCVTWTWNVPDNSCSGSGCKECVLCGNSIPISGTTPNKDWISGSKSCYLSAGSTSCLRK